MLFLAVFCGMLAEYKLEHYIEHQREKKYISSLVRDIEMDIASLQSSYDARRIQVGYLDSLKYLLQNGYEQKLNDFYYYARHITRHTGFRYHDRTIQQLKNSGNMRLIRNPDAADSITVYDNERMKTSLINLEGEGEARRHIAFNYAGRIFDAFTWDSMTDSTGRIIRPVNSAALITKDKSLLNDFTFRVVTLKNVFLFTNRVILTTIQSAKRLIEILKEEYNLD